MQGRTLSRKVSPPRYRSFRTRISWAWTVWPLSGTSEATLVDSVCPMVRRGSGLTLSSLARTYLSAKKLLGV